MSASGSSSGSSAGGGGVSTMATPLLASAAADERLTVRMVYGLGRGSRKETRDTQENNNYCGGGVNCDTLQQV